MTINGIVYLVVQPPISSTERTPPPRARGGGSLATRGGGGDAAPIGEIPRRGTAHARPSALTDLCLPAPTLALPRCREGGDFSSRRKGDCTTRACLGIYWAS